MQCIVLCSLVTVALVVATGLAVGSLAGSVGGILGRLDLIRDHLAAGTPVIGPALADARDAAADACLFLGVTAVGTVLGALVGAKLWPRPARRVRTGDGLGAGR